MTLDILAALRTAAVIAAAGELAEYKGEPAIFTRRPIPDDAPDLYLLVNPPAAITDADGLNSDRPIVTHDLAVYGRKGTPGGTSDQTRDVERISFLLRAYFHRDRFSVLPSGYYAIDVQARGPFVAPTDDEQTVGRIVSLTIRLRRE